MNRKEGLVYAFCVLDMALVILLMLLPPSPFGILLALILFAVLFTACTYSENRDPLRRTHLPRIYYVLFVVAVGAIALTLLLSYAVEEARWWLGLLALVEFFFSLPLILYVMIMSIMPE